MTEKEELYLRLGIKIAKENPHISEQAIIAYLEEQQSYIDDTMKLLIRKEQS